MGGREGERREGGMDDEGDGGDDGVVMQEIWTWKGAEDWKGKRNRRAQKDACHSLPPQQSKQTLI